MEVYTKTLVLFILFFFLSSYNNYSTKKNNDFGKYQITIMEALSYCKTNNLNVEFFILIDFGIHSGLKRFFILDLNKKLVTRSFLVSHGCGNATWGSDLTKNSPKFSNE